MLAYWMRTDTVMVCYQAENTCVWPTQVSSCADIFAPPWSLWAQVVAVLMIPEGLDIRALDMLMIDV